MLLIKTAVSQFSVHRMSELIAHIFFAPVIFGFDHVKDGHGRC